VDRGMKVRVAAALVATATAPAIKERRRLRRGVTTGT